MSKMAVFLCLLGGLNIFLKSFLFQAGKDYLCGSLLMVLLNNNHTSVIFLHSFSLFKLSKDVLLKNSVKNSVISVCEHIKLYYLTGEHLFITLYHDLCFLNLCF